MLGEMRCSMENHQQGGMNRHEEAKLLIAKVIGERFVPLSLLSEFPEYSVETEVRIGNSDFQMKMDVVLTYLEKQRKLFFEIKTQGDQGNAHERCYRLISPGVLSRMRFEGGWAWEDPQKTPIAHSVRPIVVVFCGDILGKQNFLSETKQCFDEYYENYLCLDLTDEKWESMLISHIENKFLGRLTQ